jgi:hypothetical protein
MLWRIFGAFQCRLARHEREEAPELLKPSSLPFWDPRFTESPTDILLCAVAQARRSRLFELRVLG